MNSSSSSSYVFGKLNSLLTTVSSAATTVTSAAKETFQTVKTKLEEEKEKLVEAVLNAAKEIGPRTYVLEGLKNKKNPIYWTVGCQGSGTDAQKKVAELMQKIAETSPDQRPDFILFLGDNFYDCGVNSPIDEVFNTQFHKVYGFNIPCFLILGNHDYNKHKKARVKHINKLSLTLDQGRHLGLYQRAHTFVPDGVKYNAVDDLSKLFNQKTLDLKKLQQFNMPHSYYSLIPGNTEIFCLDSNYLLEDFLAYENGEKDPNKNQIAWLLKEYKEAKKAGREIHFAMHHAPFTSGKRAIHSDIIDYLDLSIMSYEEKIALLNKKLGNDTIFSHNHNELILLILKKFGLKPDLINAAHDHLHCIDDNPDFLVTTCGGGGGDLQTRKSFKRHPDVLLLSKYGFQAVSEKGIEIYTPKLTEKGEVEVGLHLKYDHKNREFVRELADDDSESLRVGILLTCYKYLKKLQDNEDVLLAAEKQKKEEKKQKKSMLTSIFSAISDASSMILETVYPTISAEDLDCVHEFMAFFNQPKLPEYKDIIAYLITQSENLKTKTGDFSFYNFFYDHLKQLDIDLKFIQLGFSSSFEKGLF